MRGREQAASCLRAWFVPHSSCSSLSNYDKRKSIENFNLWFGRRDSVSRTRNYNLQPALVGASARTNEQEWSGIIFTDLLIREINLHVEHIDKPCRTPPGEHQEVNSMPRDSTESNTRRYIHFPDVCYDLNLGSIFCSAASFEGQKRRSHGHKMLTLKVSVAPGTRDFYPSSD